LRTMGTAFGSEVGHLQRFSGEPRRILPVQVELPRIIPELANSHNRA
jgi:hypothetical protein